MFLKRIDVLGFKSFADKTVVDFSPGITAVVGPNGSGKSNIADAIRWVLGEQSARNLRGSKMEDVIFAGSENRRSINFCEVSLTLDNQDQHLPVLFDEVTITRRVYRSGESEYLLNQQPCRLKDITELFMDSGLGRESYSIIGQGKIEEMLSTRPEDRRGPFEDAAGIVKYKHRRKEAERKLDETSVNLLRVDDLLSELERQAGPLEKEAQRSAAYKRLQQTFRQLDISLMVHEIDHLQERWQSAASSMETLVAARESQSQALAAAEERLRLLRERFDIQSAALESGQANLVASVEERERTEGTLAVLKERLKNNEKALADRKVQQAGLTQEQEEVRAKEKELSLRHQSLSADLESRQAELEAATAAVDPTVRAQFEVELEQLNAALIEAHHRAATLRNNQKSAEEALSLDDRKAERLEQDFSKWQAESDRLHAEVTSVLEMQQRLQAQIREKESSVAELAEKAKQFARDESEQGSRLQRLQSDAAALASRLELLKDLEEGYDGYAAGVRTVLTASSRNALGGIHGAIVNLIGVNQAHELAIETALGAAVQNIVVDTEVDARSAIEMLKKRQAGRATFMPLDVVKSRRLNPQDVNRVRGLAGFVGVASDLVSFEERYRDVVENLLGNVVIAAQLVDANGLARALGYRVRIVTLDGDVVSPGGIMSGGSHSRRGPGLLGRARERGDVEAKLQSVTAEIQRGKARQVEMRKELEALQRKQSQSMAEIEGWRKEIANHDAALRELRAKLENANERQQSVAWEREQLESGQAAWQERLEKAKAEIAIVQAELEGFEQTIAERRAELAARDEAEATMRERLTSLRVEAAAMTQEQNSLAQQLQEVTTRLRRLAERDSALRSESQTMLTSGEETAKTIEATQARLAELSAAVADREAQLSQLRQVRQALEAEVAQADREWRAAGQAVNAAEEQVHRAEVMAERTDVELNNALRRLGDVYQMTYEWAKEHVGAADEPDVAKREADKLRREMAALGDVQLGAEEEWQRLSERMNFLQTERDDLRDAEAQLRAVIGEINEEMTRRFLDAFEQIRVEFAIAFRQLFNGGRADLELTDPEDVLHTGIEVIAQPPGKKLQNLNLMSGGERALIAMAMLFAILRVRPVPFCVLDEVEAALDEANVSRFAQQLKRFAAETQFIVITHRRGTMEEADALYGVTMQQSGISSLVSVRLADDSDVETA